MIADGAAKLRASIALCEQAKLASGGRCIVAFSGGKDSLAVLDLVVRVFGAENIHAYFMYFVQGLACVEAPMRAALTRYPGVQLVEVPHWDLARYFRLGILCPPRADASSIRALKIADVERLVRRRTGADWIATGWRKADSVTRRVALDRNGPIWQKSRKFFPIADWLDAETYGYLGARKIPIPSRFGHDSIHGVSGMGLRAQTLRYLRDQHPDDYAKVVRVFPLAPAQLVRLEMYPELEKE